MNDIKNLDELKKHFDIYNYAALYNIDGECIIRYNKPGTDYAKKQKQILTHLTSEMTPEGLYIVKMRNDLNKGGSVFEVCYKKGDPENLEELKEKLNEPVTMKEEGKENILSYQAALNFEKKIMRLEHENEILRDQVADLTSEIEEAEEEAEELETKQKTLSEIAPKNDFASIIAGLKDIVPSVTGVFQTHFDIKERELKLKEKQINNGSPAANIPADQKMEVDEEIIQVLKYLQLLKQSKPDEYKEIIESMKNPG